jgi:hypothetical protein
MAVAATAANHPGAIPDQESHSPANSDIRPVVVNQENYADLAGHLGIQSDMATADYTAGDHRTDPDKMDHRCCRSGSVGR